MFNRIFIIGGIIFIAGCSAIPVSPQAQQIEISTEKPAKNCKLLGEAIGSQGNWFTGDVTSNENLMAGARNDLRNKAAQKNGNYVWLQNTSNTNAHGSLGTTNTTVIGNVYRCPVFEN